jgi:CRISPR-associated protein Csb2
VADLLRTAALSRLGALRGQRRASLLARRDAGGARLTGHRHAHFLALPDGQRRLDELVVWAPGGLAEDEVAALAGIEVVQPPHGTAGPRVTVRVSGYGPARQVLADQAGPAVRWRSVTPFVPARHPRRDWPGFVAAEVRRELSVRGMPPPAGVDARKGDWRSFVRYRPSRLTDTPPDRRGAGRGELLELTFAGPVAGPLALGHLSHFGLGLFRPAPPG